MNAGRLDGVVAVPGGYLAIEGARTSTDRLNLEQQLSLSGHKGMLFSPDGRRWRVVVAPHVPDQIKSDITVGLLYVDGDRVLAVGVDPEADEAYARSHGRATGRVVIDHAHPIVWQRTPDGAWKLLTAASTQTNGELEPAAPTQAAVEAVARVGADGSWPWDTSALATLPTRRYGCPPTAA